MHGKGFNVSLLFIEAFQISLAVMDTPVDHLQESLAARRLKECVALALGETLLQVEAMGQR